MWVKSGLSSPQVRGDGAAEIAGPQQGAQHAGARDDVEHPANEAEKADREQRVRGIAKRDRPFDRPLVLDELAGDVEAGDLPRDADSGAVAGFRP